MAKIRKIDELDAVSEKMNIQPVTRGELANLTYGKSRYIITDIWVLEKDEGDDGSYLEFKMPIGDDLKKLVAETLLKFCNVVVDTSKLSYVEYPDNEVWVNYSDKDIAVYQCKVDILRNMTTRDYERLGIQDDLAR